MKARQLIRPDRIRTIERPFGWIPCRLLQDGYLRQMGTLSQNLYFFLSIVADRRGISFYGDECIQETIFIGDDELYQARQELIQLDLLAFEEKTYQLLSLPYGHAMAKPKLDIGQKQEKPDPTEYQEGTIPEEARQILNRLFGVKFS
jgi:hypothetical protein